MLGAELLRLAGRMQWIRKQKKSRHELVLGGAQHRRLAPTIGMSPEKYSARDILAQSRNRVSKAVPIPFRIPWKRWAGWFLLPEWQITAKNTVAVLCKNLA
jgi:hypothetical protein